MSDENKAVSVDPVKFEAERKRQLENLVSAAIAANPKLKDVLTMAAAEQFMRLPGESLGWMPDKGALTYEVRALSVITHFKLGATFGLKHLLWMGNGFYPTAAFWTSKVNKDVKKIGAQIFRDFTDDEKRMFKVTDADMYCAVEESVNVDGISLTWVGHGIIGADELAKTGSNGKGLPGRASTKDRMKTLKTRAVLDMYSRNYPIDGMTVSAEDMIEATDYSKGEGVTIFDTVATETNTAELMSRLKKLAEEKQIATDRFYSLAEKAATFGKVPDEIIGVPTSDMLEKSSPQEIHDYADAIEYWLEENNTPPPEPPKKEKPAAKPAPVAASPAASMPGEPPKRGRGRPAKAATVANTEKAAVTVVEASIAQITVEDLETFNAEVTEQAPTDPFIDENPEDDNWLSETADAEIDDFDNGHSADNIIDEFALEPSLPPEPEIYEGTEAQKDVLRKALDAVGVTENQSRYALAGAMKGRPMDALDSVIQGLLKSLPPKKPEPVAVKPVAPVAPIANGTEARKHLRSLCDKVIAAGGATMSIVGVNPHNIISEGTMAAVTEATQKLEKWLAANTKAGVVHPIAKPKDAPTITVPSGPRPFPEIPENIPGQAAFALLKKWTGSPTLKPEVKEKITDLAYRNLKDGDHLHLHAMVKLANEGNFKEVDAFIASRPVRK